MWPKKVVHSWGIRLAQLVKHLASAQVMILQYVSSSPRSGPVLQVESLETASNSVCPSLYASSPLTLSLQ